MNTPPVRIHGLVVRSELPLAGLPAPDESPDVVFRIAERRNIPLEAPAGEPVLAATSPTAHYYAARAGRVTTLRFPALVDFVIDTESGEIAVHTAADAPDGLIATLIAGNVLSVLLALRGTPVLHASAVGFGRAAVAFVGGSGAGKSSLAALLCSRGMHLVADDVLRVEVTAAKVRALAGTSLIRLRPPAHPIAELFGATAMTADGRFGVSSPAADATLGALVFPGLTPRSGFRLEELSSSAAVSGLMRFPRISGWRLPSVMTDYLDMACELVDRLPALRLHVPWPPGTTAPWIDELHCHCERALGR